MSRTPLVAGNWKMHTTTAEAAALATAIVRGPLPSHVEVAVCPPYTALADVGRALAGSSVALGACILERHFTDTRYRKGPDISCSMDPAELRFLIDRSREIWIAANNPKQRSAPEEDVYRFARGSVVADRDLPEGHVIREEDIWARRPGTGEIPAHDVDKVVGKRLNRAVRRNTQLKWGDLG